MKYTYVFILFLILFSCDQKDKEKTNVEWNQKRSTDLNRELAVRQEMQIIMYLEQHPERKMTATGTGLRYSIFQEGKGDSARVGMTAQVETKLSLLDGTICYETASDEMEEFLIDKSDVESGIQEGVKKMAVGDRAKLIIPSHLAHGLIGDLDKIPPLSVIVVDIHLIGLKK